MWKSLYLVKIEDTGVVLQIIFYGLCRLTNTWLYFGCTEAQYPRPDGYDTIPFTEYAAVRFPSDLDDLPRGYYYTMLEPAYIAGLNREGLLP